MRSAALKPWLGVLLLSAFITQLWGADESQAVYRDAGHELASSANHQRHPSKPSLFAEEGDEEADEGENGKLEKEGYTMGLAMIGGILLIMGLFYLVHHNDMDIRKTTWIVISNTISIFCAVMIFSWVNEFFNVLIFNSLSFDEKRYANKGWSAFFYLLFVGSLSAKAGVFEPHSSRQVTIKTEFVHAVTKNAMGSSIVWAHVVGFAMTHGWGMTQTSRERPYHKSPFQAALILPWILFLFTLYLWVMYMVRKLLMVMFIEAWKPGDKVILHDLHFDPKLRHYNGKCGTLQRFEKGKWIVLTDKEKNGEGGHELEVRYTNLGVTAEAVIDIRSHEEIDHAKHFKEVAHEIVGGFYVDEDRGSTIDIPHGHRIAIVGTVKHDWWSFCRGSGCCLPLWAKVQYNEETGLCRYEDLDITDGQPNNGEEPDEVGRVPSFVDPSLSTPMLMNSEGKELWEDRAAVGVKGKEHDKMVEIWEERIEEGENDIMAINVAFAIIQCLRYAVGGCLPNAEGKEEWEPKSEECEGPKIDHIGLCTCADEETFFNHTFGQVIWLYFWAFMMLSTVFIENIAEWVLELECIKLLSEKLHELLNRRERSCPLLVWAMRTTRKICWRLVDVFLNVGTMGCSWAVIYATKWWLARQTWTLHDKSIVSVYLAILVSILSMPFIWAMDKLADTGLPFADKLRDIQRGTGFLIGFTWESVFDDSVDSIGEVLIGEEEGGLKTATLKAFLGLTCLALIIPAWCFYIIPMVEEGGYKMGFIARNLHNRIQRSLQEYVRTDKDEGNKKHRKAQLNHLKYYAKKLKLIEESINFHIEHAYKDNDLGEYDEEELMEESEEESGEESEEEDDLEFPGFSNSCCQRPITD